jgi:hypothetical protein
MLVGEAQPLGTGAREPGCEQTRKVDQGGLHPSPSQGLDDHAGQSLARQTKGKWKLRKRLAAQQTPA